jgi:hypothetical protein
MKSPGRTRPVLFVAGISLVCVLLVLLIVTFS